MAVVEVHSRCTLWCPECGKVLSIGCKRPDQVATGRHANCVIGFRAFWEERLRNLEEYYDVRAIVWNRG